MVEESHPNLLISSNNNQFSKKTLKIDLNLTNELGTNFLYKRVVTIFCKSNIHHNTL